MLKNIKTKIDANIEREKSKLNSFRDKLKASANGASSSMNNLFNGTSSSGGIGNSSGSVGGGGINNSGGVNGSPKHVRKHQQRAYQLNFNEPIQLPPALPVIEPGKDILGSILFTEYNETTPFSFYYEEFEESITAPNALVDEDEIPPMNEPTEGMHPYGFDQLQFNTKRQEQPVQDIKPWFLSGNPNPLRPFNQTAPQCRILNFNELQASNNMANVTYICITDTPLGKKQRKILWKRLALCPLVETLILKNIGIGSIHKQARFPNLRFCDISQNKISSLRAIRKITKYSKLLEVLNLIGNPLVKDTDYTFRLSAKLPFLETLSQKQIPIDERIKAVSNYGTSEERSNINSMRWRLNLDNVAEIRACRPVQPGWQPQMITRLVFQNAGLQYFYVGNLVSLQHLDLSLNSIIEIDKQGLEKCEHLSFISFRSNQIYHINQLNIFELVPSARVVIVDGNPYLDNYRSKLIYLTRNVKGTNRAPGLVQIDDALVTREERIQAVESFEPPSSGSSSAAIYRWRLLLIERYGHRQLQHVPDYLTKVKSVTFSECDLSLCDVSVFSNVQVLDFSKNRLVNFTGLQVLTKLRVLYLHDNPQLDTNTILQQFLSLEKLESITFYVSDPGHSRSINNQEYRTRMLQHTIPKNRNLVLVDNTTINFNERVNAYSNAGYPKEVVEKYRFFLATTVNCTMHFNRGIHPDQVEIGKQYNPNDITTLRRLRDWNLISEACNFSYFVNLTELDLTNNKLVDITNIGLQTLNQLTRLSLINNQIQTPIPLIAQLMDQLTNLEIIALRQNPIMKTSTDRLTLIGYLQSMKQLQSTLKVIDSEITIHDKVEGWKLVGGSLRDAEIFKLSFIISIKQLNLYEHTLVNLELCDCALEYLDVSPFVNLKALLLPNNRFTAMENINALDSLPDLFALDLRYNQLASVENTRDAVLKLHNLQVLGIFGNPFTKNHSNYRVKFLSNISPIFQQHKYPLSILDTHEILPEEVSDAAIASKIDSQMDKKELIFNISVLRRAPTLQMDALVELDLSGCHISNLYLTKFPRLILLNLSDNSISDANLKDSGINHLQELKALDIRGNKLKDLVNLCKIIDLLNIETLFMEENSCFEKDNEKDRIRFFKKLTNSKILTTMKYLNGVPISSGDIVQFGKTKSRK